MNLSSKTAIIRAEIDRYEYLQAVAPSDRYKNIILDLKLLLNEILLNPMGIDFTSACNDLQIDVQAFALAA